ncbi:aspartate/glutamate racemase family protein [Terrimonas sp. NA20]|uniref:Aspartate/glutamate racemase family protein n=1 Tax=Terrimonas ginsenosidimutans TaxID=2908004 RepID=A0ABS9KLH6_9BACT|nr:aspartate/glutamate racemase family protein [Terrimonas ginsenosidimutans]MCG2613180.1 aspartate/glutamate racemase family protein [Terrimonas ginsenosidimutans]
MKTIGLIGGITWLSSVEYYRLLNTLVNQELGGVSSAKIILHSVDFAEIKSLTEAGRWDRILELMTDAAKKLEAAGAGCILLGANTMHKLADDLQASINIPLLHIADETGEQIRQDGLQTVALLGTKYTMQLPFYSEILSAYDITTIIPGQDDIDYINNAIYTEMGKGIFLPETKRKFLDIIHQLADRGAQGVILGCTEIPLLLQQKDTEVKLYDTTLIHSKAAVRFALGKNLQGD